MSELMTSVAPPIQTERKCKIEEVFDQSLIELIQMAPKNPYVRALILKLTRKMPGTEHETFDQIKEWVEMNCEKKARLSPVRPIGNDGILIGVEFAETEYGQADYSVRRYGSEQFRVDADDLLEIIQDAIEAGESMDAIVESIANKIDEDAWSQCEPAMDDYGDYDYDEHEASESGNSETTFSRSEIRERVLAFVRERHPELAAEI